GRLLYSRRKGGGRGQGLLLAGPGGPPAGLFLDLAPRPPGERCEWVDRDAVAVPLPVAGYEAVDEDGLPHVAVDRDHLRAVLVRKHARAVLVREQQLLPAGEEASRGGDAAVCQWRPREVEQLAALLVAKRPEP